MARVSPEHLLQVQVIERVRLELARTLYPELQGPKFRETGALRLYATPNGGFRPIHEAVKLKAEGVQGGVPDLTLPIPRHGFSGLYLELKSARGRLEDVQVDWLAFLDSQGFATAVEWTADAAFSCISDYMNPAPCERWAARPSATNRPSKRGNDVAF